MVPCLICGIVDQEMRRIHDLGEAGLVVGAQQRGAVGRDDVVADLVGQRRMLGGADHLGGIGRQHDVAAAIVLDDLRLDVLAGAIRRGVHMRAEADHRHLLVGVRRDRRIDIAVLVEMGVGEPDRLQLGGEQAAQILLLLGGRAGRRGRVGLGVDHDIAQEALGHGVGERRGKEPTDREPRQRSERRESSIAEKRHSGAASSRNDASSRESEGRRVRRLP